MNPALIEVSAYHDVNVSGYFAIRCNGKQDLHRMIELPYVLDRITGDSYISQADFRSPRNRRRVNVLRVRCNFVDCDTYKTPLADVSHQHFVQTLLLFCDDEGIPKPNLINFSGRGYHVKWRLVEPIPAAALSRWGAVQKTLAKKLAPFGVDMGALDATRMLRCMGTINPRSGQEAVTVWVDGGAWDFETLAYETLRWTREEVQQWREKKTAKNARKTEAETKRRSNWWLIPDLWCHRLEDIRTLVELRGWDDGVPVGSRNNVLFIAAISISWAFGKEKLEAEVAEFARQVCPSLSLSAVRSSVSSVVARARSDNQYKPKNAYIIDLLGITAEEQKHLKTLYGDEERIRRRKEYDSSRQWGTVDRETYEADARQRREQAQVLRATGLSYRTIAERMGLTFKQVDNLLNRKP